MLTSTGICMLVRNKLQSISKRDNSAHVPGLYQAESRGRDDEEEASAPGESQDEYVMRRTKEFNVAVRERSHDLQLWLDYAAFQDDIPRYAPAAPSSTI